MKPLELGKHLETRPSKKRGGANNVTQKIKRRRMKREREKKHVTPLRDSDKTLSCNFHEVRRKF